ncbi:hypothetical protein HPB48_026050 [Haemaphysalis longicornis]|uniref:Uncharacterized protein n=1 Tax=Haemaphysalis longicornis TaxID=44386 RepID=A0A9J6H8N8_HAELO|nr:hypothetical protein HPB48_026050 [Haemaphysalis longicornis]
MEHDACLHQLESDPNLARSCAVLRTEGRFWCTDVRFVHSQAPALSETSSNFSEDMVRFLKDQVESHQEISLHKLTGHLSQLHRT